MNLKQYLMWFKGTYSYNSSFILVFDKSTDLLLSQILITQYRLKHSIGADLIFFMLYLWYMKEHFIRVMKKGIVRSWLPENFKLLTLPILEIWSIMCSQNSHLWALCCLILKIKSFKVQIIEISTIDTELVASYKDTYLIHFAIWIKKLVKNYGFSP